MLQARESTLISSRLDTIHPGWGWRQQEVEELGGLEEGTPLGKVPERKSCHGKCPRQAHLCLRVKAQSDWFSEMGQSWNFPQRECDPGGGRVGPASCPAASQGHPGPRDLVGSCLLPHLLAQPSAFSPCP